MKNLKITLFLFAICLFTLVACPSSGDEEGDTMSALLVMGSGFSDNNNGTVDQGALTWMKCSQGQVWSATLNNCAGSGGGTTWNAVSLKFCSILTANYADCTTSDVASPTATSGPAFDHCSALSFAGFSDWRLPAKSELELMTLNINRTAFLYLFPETPDDKLYWSGTGNEAQSDGSEAYGVNFSGSQFGLVETATKDSVKYVRCIRTK